MTIARAIGGSIPAVQNLNSQFADAAPRAVLLSPIGRLKVLGNSRFEIRIGRRYIRDDLFHINNVSNRDK